MYLITRQNLADKAAQRWGEQYAVNPTSEQTTILARLNALPPGAPPDDIDQIIGNGSWTKLECDECGTIVDAIIQLGQEPDYESSTASVCFDCLKAAIKLSRN